MSRDFSRWSSRTTDRWKRPDASPTWPGSWVSLKWEPCSTKSATTPTAKSVASFCAAHHMNIVGEIPYDAGLADAERAGQPPLDYGPESASVAAMRRLAADLVAGASESPHSPTRPGC